MYHITKLANMLFSAGSTVTTTGVSKRVLVGTENQKAWYKIEAQWDGRKLKQVLACRADSSTPYPITDKEAPIWISRLQAVGG